MRYLTITEAGRHLGRLPSPEALERFDRVLPGLADRITTMSEGWARDQWLNNRTTRWSTILGQVFAFVVAMTIILGGFYLVLHDKSPEGITAVVGTVGAIVAAFIYRRRNTSSE